MPIRLTILVDGLPLKRTFIEHAGMFVTDNYGVVNLPGNASGGFNIKIHCQNAVVRILDGANSNIEVSHELTAITSDTTVDLGTSLPAGKLPDQFRMLQQAIDVYDLVWRQFSPFSNATRLDFPFGMADSLQTAYSQVPRIELSYPDSFPGAELAFNEPKSASTGFPLIHIKDKSQDLRLFGVPATPETPTTPGIPATLATLIPHELSHALNFALLPQNLRQKIQDDYLNWLISSPYPYHSTSTSTNVMVAYIEALGLFSERFFVFKKNVFPQLSGGRLINEFVNNELSDLPGLEDVMLNNGYQQVGRLNQDGIVEPLLKGARVEGAIYGAIFLDFARRVSLREAVRLYLRSDALNFEEYRSFVILTKPDFETAINEVAETWGLNILQNGIYSIQSKLSGKVLDVDKGPAGLDGQRNSQALQQWDSWNGDNQKFKLERNGEGFYKITAMHSGKVLDVQAKSLDNRVPLIQFRDTGRANQQFSIVPVLNNAYKIVARHSGKALDVTSESTDNGAKIIQFIFGNRDNQLWFFNKIENIPAQELELENGVYIIESKLSGKVLDVDAGPAGVSAKDDGRPLQQWGYWNSDHQKFRIVRSDGYYRIYAIHSGKCLDVSGASMVDGAPIIQYHPKKRNIDNQQFSIIKVGTDTYRIEARHSGKVFDVLREDRNDGAKIAQFGFHGGDNQLWLFRPL